MSVGMSLVELPSAPGAPSGQSGNDDWALAKRARCIKQMKEQRSFIDARHVSETVLGFTLFPTC